MINWFFLYDLLYTSFLSFKTEYIYDKQYKAKIVKKVLKKMLKAC